MAEAKPKQKFHFNSDGLEKTIILCWNGLVTESNSLGAYVFLFAWIFNAWNCRIRNPTQRLIRPSMERNCFQTVNELTWLAHITRVKVAYKVLQVHQRWLLLIHTDKIEIQNENLKLKKQQQFFLIIIFLFLLRSSIRNRACNQRKSIK